MLERLRIPHLLLIAFGLIVLSVLIAIYPTYTYLRAVVQDAMFPLVQFDSNELVEFQDDDPYARYVLALDIDHPDEPLPSIDVEISSPDGEVTTHDINQWARLFGREYRRFLVIDAPNTGRFNLKVGTDSNEDFILYRSIEDVAAKQTRRSLPLWIVACVPLALSFGTLVLILLRAMRDSDHVSLDLGR